MRPIELVSIKNLNFGNNLKIGHLGQKCPFGLLAAVIRELITKNFGLRELKCDTYTKKLKPIGKILVNWRGCSFVLKITKKTYFTTLSYFVVIQYFAISFISIHPKLFQIGDL